MLFEPSRVLRLGINVILDSQGRDWDDFGSTTFKQPEIAGVEPDGYVKTSTSRVFPNLPVTEFIPQLVQKAIDEGASKMLRELKIQLYQ